MAATHQVWVTSPTGSHIKLLENIEVARFTLVVNGVSAFMIKLDPAYREFIMPPNCLVYYRKPSGSNSTRRVFSGPILTVIDAAPNDAIELTIGGYDWNWLLDGRNVLYYANTDSYSNANSQFTSTPADDAMKAIVRANAGVNATTGNGRLRAGNYNSTYFTVAADESLGPSLSKGHAYLNVLDTLREISDAARRNGTRIYFRVVPVTRTRLEFRTYKNRMGVDRTRAAGGPSVFSWEAGTIKSPRRVLDYRSYASVVAALGQGKGDQRNVQFAEETALSDMAWFFRRETVAYAADIAQTTNEDALVLAEANRKLQAMRPIHEFATRLISRPGSEFGADWDLGDELTASFLGVTDDVLISAVDIELSSAGETITGLPEVL